MYRGFPCPSIEVIVNKIELSEEEEKLDRVIGSNNKAEANIAGITPAVFTLRGKYEDSPPYILFPCCLFGYCIKTLLCALSTKTIK